MMWAMTIVVVPSVKLWLNSNIVGWRNSVSSDAPSTISGAVSGSTSRKLTGSPPLMR